jgi:hypothetical protein
MHARVGIEASLVSKEKEKTLKTIKPARVINI